MSQLVIGVDEVGRGPLAGPVVAAATAFDHLNLSDEFTDSKKLSQKKRDYLFEKIKDSASDWAIVSLGPRTIDQLNIREAAKLAMSIAADLCSGELILVDGNMPIYAEVPQQTIIKGDLLRKEIGAASILAKVWRDRRMEEYEKAYPGYGLAKHAGYPTKAHKEAIATLGVSLLHRKSFKGVKEWVVRPGDCHASLAMTTSPHTKENNSNVEEFRIITPDEDTIHSCPAPAYWQNRGTDSSNVCASETAPQSPSRQLEVQIGRT